MNPVKVMVNGMPGNMARLVAARATGDGRFTVIPCSLTGPEISAGSHRLDEQVFTLLRPEDRDEAIGAIRERYGAFISVDYTHPEAANPNAAFYCRHNLPFVMGTTGGRRQALVDQVQTSAIAAVISPNMAKQIVGFQAMMAHAAEKFPGLFQGYTLKVRESHQQGKADTSGTAKAMVTYFNRLGTPFSPEQIEMERSPEIQRKQWGIPEAHLSGHGWHTYELFSPEGTVRFRFDHNVNGRDVYAEGTLDAVCYLQEKVNQGIQGVVFSMIDVLQGI